MVSKILFNLENYLEHNGFLSEANAVNYLIKVSKEESTNLLSPSDKLEFFYGFENPVENGINLNGNFYSVPEIENNHSLPEMIKNLIRSYPGLEGFQKHLEKNTSVKE